MLPTGAGTSYYAVAVVKKSSNFTINTLKGARSCHTGYEKTSGWNVPVGYFIDSGRMSAVVCDIPKGVSDYFSKSCVPGVDELKYPSLCDLCKGNSNNGNQCGQDKYQDYNGAFRCLVDEGDVAFVKHSTVLDNSDDCISVIKMHFGTNLPAGRFGRRAAHAPAILQDGGAQGEDGRTDTGTPDYQLLCRDGTRADVTEWKRCNLARVPAHAVVVRPDVDGSLIYKMLHEGQQKYNSPSSSFQMFDSTRLQCQQLTVQRCHDRTTDDL
ncbi:unnamed protein product [Ranitomeya imitator]|uniref:Transferrin-like domain-containing protein n=1 Tax=Ranitomeya imitator TaxID=111125 RepID=A0ABN9L5B4_9NEOB|nr:unnamed protein product [Ranitomeya imitator]